MQNGVELIQVKRALSQLCYVQSPGINPEIRAAATNFSRFSRRNCCPYGVMPCSCSSCCTLAPSRKQPHANFFSLSCLPWSTKRGCSVRRRAWPCSSCKAHDPMEKFQDSLNQPHWHYRSTKHWPRNAKKWQYCSVCYRTHWRTNKRAANLQAQ